MSTLTKTFLIVLLLLNSMVLLGQLWPEGAPPFARTANIVTLVLNLVFFMSLLIRKTK